MKRPIILQGEPFDWEAGQQAMLNVVGPDGDVNWGAAMAVDPGCMQCPSCGEWLWREGTVVACRTCHTVFVVNNVPAKPTSSAPDQTVSTTEDVV